MSEHLTPPEGVRAINAERIQIDELAEQFFNVYNETGPSPWKTFDGRDVPRWADLINGDQVRGKWRAVARLALELA